MRLIFGVMSLLVVLAIVVEFQFLSHGEPGFTRNSWTLASVAFSSDPTQIGARDFVHIHLINHHQRWEQLLVE